MTNSNKPSNRLETIAIGSAVLIGMAIPVLLWWGFFSGDAEIHLVYARNLLRGYPLQFNLNTPNSGETSMGYMLIVALLMKALGAALTPLAMKVLCLASLYATAFATYLIAKETFIRRPWPQIAALLVLWFPGNAYVAMYGTENVVFAALSGYFVYAVLRAQWFDEKGPDSLFGDALAGVVAGLLFWLRPEAAPLVAILLVVRLISAIAFKRNWRREVLGVAILAGIFALSICAYVVIFRHYAGEMPFGAGKARRILSIFGESIVFHGLSIDIKVLIRIASYFTLVVPALSISVAALKRKDFGLPLRLRVLALAGIFVAFLLAYLLNVLPAIHFARYSIFVWPYGIILAVLCLQWIGDTRWLRRGLNAALLTALLLCFVGTATYETRLRLKMTGPDRFGQVERVGEIPANRDNLSAAMAHHLGIPVGTQASLAYQEVQLRYDLTDNFTIISLDGITDSRLAHYICDKWIDHDGYLIDTKVDYLMQTPNYNADKSEWALSDLSSLKIGQALVRPGITYLRIQPDVFQVRRTVGAASDRPGGICRRDK